MATENHTPSQGLPAPPSFLKPAEKTVYITVSDIALNLQLLYKIFRGCGSIVKSRNLGLNAATVTFNSSLEAQNAVALSSTTVFLSPTSSTKPQPVLLTISHLEDKAITPPIAIHAIRAAHETSSEPTTYDCSITQPKATSSSIKSDSAHPSLSTVSASSSSTVTPAISEDPKCVVYLLVPRGCQVDEDCLNSALEKFDPRYTFVILPHREKRATQVKITFADAFSAERMLRRITLRIRMADAAYNCLFVRTVEDETPSFTRTRKRPRQDVELNPSMVTERTSSSENPTVPGSRENPIDVDQWLDDDLPSTKRTKRSRTGHNILISTRIRSTPAPAPPFASMAASPQTTVQLASSLVRRRRVFPTPAPGAPRLSRKGSYARRGIVSPIPGVLQRRPTPTAQIGRTSDALFELERGYAGLERCRRIQESRVDGNDSDGVLKRLAKIGRQAGQRLRVRRFREGARTVLREAMRPPSALGQFAKDAALTAGDFVRAVPRNLLLKGLELAHEATNHPNGAFQCLGSKFFGLTVPDRSPQSTEYTQFAEAAFFELVMQDPKTRRFIRFRHDEDLKDFARAGYPFEELVKVQPNTGAGDVAATWFTRAIRGRPELSGWGIRGRDKTFVAARADVDAYYGRDVVQGEYVPGTRPIMPGIFDFTEFVEAWRGTSASGGVDEVVKMDRLDQSSLQECLDRDFNTYLTGAAIAGTLILDFM